jgi:predicted dehydrogenase
MYTAAVIGAGDPDRGGGIGYAHARGYRNADQCELIACADIVEEYATAFTNRWDLPEEAAYENYEELLVAEEPDIVSICTSPAHHATITVGVAETGIPKAIHCEKPMADTWGDAQRMAEACRDRNIRLTIDHQRRVGPEWQAAKHLLADGEIGELRRVETGVPNLFDWGTHGVDLCNYMNDDNPIEWVMGQIHYPEEDLKYGVRHEQHGLAEWRYENGVYGLASTGDGSSLVGAQTRIVGESGVIEVGCHDGPDLRVYRSGDVDPETRDFEDSLLIAEAIQEVVASLADDRESALSASKALAATEVLFAVYESVRRRSRVNLPLRTADHPLESMVEAGKLPSGSSE